MDVVRAALVAALPLAGAYEEDYNLLAAACALWDAGEAEYLRGRSLYNEGAARYAEGLAQYEEAERQFLSGRAAYQTGLSQYYAKNGEYQEAVSRLEDARGELKDGRAQLEDGEEQYVDALAEYEDGQQQLADARSQLDSLEPSRWILLNCRGNSSFVQLALGSSNLTSLEMTFSLMFVLVGALVIFATISKMIDEQRYIVGAGKALGLFNREIFVKYLFFGVSATVLGTVLGILAARFLMEVYVLKSSEPFYTFDTSRPVLIVKPTVIALLAGLVLAVVSAWGACSKLLRSSAIELMQAKVPAGHKKTGKSGGHVLSLYSRLILLNICSDLRRVIVTVVSVAGCCALVVIGFTLKSAVEGCLEQQYTKIVDYDGRIEFDAEAAEQAADKIEQVLRRQGVTYTALYDGVVTFRITENLVGELLCGDLAEISSFYHLYDWKTDEPLTPTDDGVFVQKRTAENYDLEVGSELELALGGTKTVRVRVAGIFDNYIGRIMLMSPACYRSLTGEDCRTNAFYIRLNGADDTALLDRLRQVEGFASYKPSDSDKSLFASSSALVTAIVALFIFMAAVMAGVVLTNLTNIYILQKKRELTIMRINGFTVREVIGYVLRETVVTTLLGILFGIAMGAGVAYNITRSMESVFIQYDRSVSPVAWLYGAVITTVFALIINAVVLRKVRDLRLTDVN